MRTHLLGAALFAVSLLFPLLCPAQSVALLGGRPLEIPFHGIYWSMTGPNMGKVCNIDNEILGLEWAESEARQVGGVQTHLVVETKDRLRFQGQGELAGKPTIDAGPRRAGVENKFEMAEGADGSFHDDEVT